MGKSTGLTSRERKVRVLHRRLMHWVYIIIGILISILSVKQLGNPAASERFWNAGLVGGLILALYGCALGGGEVDLNWLLMMD